MKTELDYPLFKVEDNVAAWEKPLGQAISQIRPRYFATNPRFKGFENVASISLVDYMGFYEEGDWWVLTVLQTQHDDGLFKHIFLPLTARRQGPATVHADHELPVGLETAAFGLDTLSQFYGPRTWQVYDAFADREFHKKLPALFLAWKHVTEGHVNAYLEIHTSGNGEFIFRAAPDLLPLLSNAEQARIDFAKSGDIQLKYGGRYQLDFYQTLSRVSKVSSPAATEINGRTTYSGKGNLELVVGIVKT